MTEDRHIPHVHSVKRCLNETEKEVSELDLVTTFKHVRRATGNNVSLEASDTHEV